MGTVIRLPATHDQAARQLTVRAAFKAARRGDLDASEIYQVLSGLAGTHADYVALQELIFLVTRVQRHSRR